MGIFANFDIINSFQYGVGSVNSVKKAQPTTMKSLDALDQVIGKRGFEKDSQSLFAMQQVVSMNRAIEGLCSTATTQQVLAATTASQSDLNIETAESAATMQSTEEVNASFGIGVDTDPDAEGSTAQLNGSTFTVDVAQGDPIAIPGEDWSGNTADVDISGNYYGTYSGELNFDVTLGGTHGEDRLRVVMSDAQGNTLKTVTLQAADAIDKAIPLSRLSLTTSTLLTGNTTWATACRCPWRGQYSPGGDIHRRCGDSGRIFERGGHGSFPGQGFREHAERHVDHQRCGDCHRHQHRYAEQRHRPDQ